MENAASALKMAAAILIFVLAIATSFSVFGTAKKTADSIIGMRDKQAYLEAAELDNGILYTSSIAIQGDTTGLTQAQINAQKKEESNISGVTKNGDRIVSVSDVISTIYRYAVEKYGVTIIEESTKKVIARFSTATEGCVANYNAYDSTFWTKYTNEIKKNIKTDYVENPIFNVGVEELYRVTGGSSNYDAKWLGNDANIQERINKDIYGGTFEKDGVTYTGKKLLNELSGKTIVEVTNEIDESKYLQEDLDGDGALDDTDLLQQYQIPTVEIVYIIM